MEALYVCTDGLVNANRIRNQHLGAGRGLPTMHGYRDYVEAGGLMSYGPNIPDLFRRSADYVDKFCTVPRRATYLLSSRPSSILP